MLGSLCFVIGAGWFDWVICSKKHILLWFCNIFLLAVGPVTPYNMIKHNWFVVFKSLGSVTEILTHRTLILKAACGELKNMYGCLRNIQMWCQGFTWLTSSWFYVVHCPCFVPLMYYHWATEISIKYCKNKYLAITEKHRSFNIYHHPERYFWNLQRPFLLSGWKNIPYTAQ